MSKIMSSNIPIKKIKYAFIAIHTLLTFFIERTFFTKEYLDMPDAALEASGAISYRAEEVAAYIIAKIFAFVIIYLLYTLIFALISGKIRKDTLKIFIPVFIFRFALSLIFWDKTFGQEPDNFITLSYAMGNMPYYWHHIFTSSLYEAMLMVYPNVINIVFLQSLAFTCTLAYLYEKLDLISKKVRVFLLLLLFLLPYTYAFSSNPYRNCFYTILCMFYFTFLISGALGKKSEYTKKRAATVIFLSLIVAVWRSEGIPLGFFGLLYECLFVSKKTDTKAKIKYICANLLIFLCLFYAAGLPQRLGSEKYHGSDYMITSLLPIASDILNCPGVNVSYPEASADLSAINKICPIYALQSQSLTGYWLYNLSCGRKLNVSGASKQDAQAMKNGVIHLITHNPTKFFITRLNLYLLVLESPFHIPVPVADRSSEIIDSQSQYPVQCITAFCSFKFVTPLLNYPPRIAAEEFLSGISVPYKKFWSETGLHFAVFSAAVFFDIFIILRGICELFKKKFDNLHFTLISGLATGQLLIVVFTMPDSRPAYLMPFFYISCVILAFYFGKVKKQEKNI